MDPTVANLIASLTVQSIHAYFTYMQMQGKTPEEIETFYQQQLAEFNSKNPASLPRPYEEE
jgi:hypothetical protein